MLKTAAKFVSTKNVLFIAKWPSLSIICYFLFAQFYLSQSVHGKFVFLGLVYSVIIIIL